MVLATILPQDGGHYKGEIMNTIVAAAMHLALQELSNEEIAAQHLAVTFGSDPRRRYGYAKIAHFYTEGDGTRMSQSAQEAFEAAVNAIYQERGVTQPEGDQP